MPVSTDRTDAELEKGLTDVGYEIDQMYEAYRLCEDVSRSAKAGANAYLESFLLHVRCLWGFYLPPRKERDKDTIDALENYAFEDSALLAWFKNHKGLRKKLHKRLAHLSFSRPSPSSSDREWPKEEMFKNVSRCTEKFIEALLKKPDLRERDEWEDRMKKLAEERSSGKQSQSCQGVRNTDSVTYFGQMNNKD